MANKIKLACIGAGYFARFHVEAWQRIAEVELVALCDIDPDNAQSLADQFNVPKVYSEVDKLLESETLDVVDIITPPETHDSICKAIAPRGIDIICQKPLAPTLEEAAKMVTFTSQQQVHFVVHENYRFQPWHRKIKELITQGEIGDRLHSLYFQMRMGDGWQDDAYLNRQPYFRTMPRLLIYETGIHFIDTFRFLAGEIKSVYADLRKLNPSIAGEDCGLVCFDFENGAKGVLDANRFNESNSRDARYTFGEMLLEGNGGTIRLYSDGTITIQKLGEAEQQVDYTHEDKNFAGDCVYFTQEHFVHCYLNQLPFENSGKDYLKNLEIQEAVYASSDRKELINI